MPDTRVALETQVPLLAASARESAHIEYAAGEYETHEPGGFAAACERLAWLLPWILAACGVLTTVALSI